MPAPGVCRVTPLRANPTCGLYAAKAAGRNRVALIRWARRVAGGHRRGLKLFFQQAVNGVRTRAAHKNQEGHGSPQQGFF